MTKDQELENIKQKILEKPQRQPVRKNKTHTEMARSSTK